jgi:glyoxylase-like metal-dependent hydrolase (beta-lactamase superfamily II)
MSTETLFLIGGCAGSFAAPTENRPVFSPEDPSSIRLEPFRREHYGSRTTCYLLRHQDTFIVIDNGLGIEPVSEFILDMWDAEGITEGVVHFLQTHFHDDHIMGLRLNALIFRHGVVCRFYGPDLGHFRTTTTTLTPGGHVMQEILQEQFSERHWPLTLDALNQTGARREHVGFLPGEVLQIDDITVKTLPLEHPGGCCGYRFEIPKVGAIVVATDYESPDDPDPEVVEFFDGAEVLLADMQYRDDEYEGTRPIGRLAISRAGWGHGTPTRLLPAILQCQQRPRRVRIVHHDPKRCDSELRLFHEETVTLLERWQEGAAFDYDFGRDGDVFWL